MERLTSAPSAINTHNSLSDYSCIEWEACQNRTRLTGMPATCTITAKSTVVTWLKLPSHAKSLTPHVHDLGMQTCGGRGSRQTQRIGGCQDWAAQAARKSGYQLVMCSSRLPGCRRIGMLRRPCSQHPVRGLQLCHALGMLGWEQLLNQGIQLQHNMQHQAASHDKICQDQHWTMQRPHERFHAPMHASNA